MADINGPIAKLQAKSGAVVDGVWGPGTFKAARDYFGLTTIQAAHFFGQCAHESGTFKIFSENLNYSADGLQKIFRKYFPDASLAAAYARQPQKIANRVYANRMGNGSESSGDGWRYRGRGAIQLTGKENYASFERSTGFDVVNNPDQVSVDLAFESAKWYFDTRKLFDIAAGGISDATITTITKKINGGIIGLEERKHLTKLYSTWG